jgi:multidrug efflux pump subunit AcrA (membrane-fusion protein)
MKTKTMVAAACASLAAMAATLAFAADAQVQQKLKAYQDSTETATRILAGMNDAQGAKAQAPALDAALKQHRADEAALNAELKKLDLGKQADGQQMEQATAAMAKVNEGLAAQQVRVLSRPELGDVVGKSFSAPAAPATKAR